MTDAGPKRARPTDDQTPTHGHARQVVLAPALTAPLDPVVLYPASIAPSELAPDAELNLTRIVDRVGRADQRRREIADRTIEVDMCRDIERLDETFPGSGSVGICCGDNRVVQNVRRDSSADWHNTARVLRLADPARAAPSPTDPHRMGRALSSWASPCQLGSWLARTAIVVTPAAAVRTSPPRRVPHRGDADLGWTAPRISVAEGRVTQRTDSSRLCGRLRRGSDRMPGAIVTA
jgi:hypothetical protein